MCTAWMMAGYHASVFSAARIRNPDGVIVLQMKPISVTDGNFYSKLDAPSKSVDFINPSFEPTWFLK
jgi:hypothetical protein